MNYEKEILMVIDFQPPIADKNEIAAIRRNIERFLAQKPIPVIWIFTTTQDTSYVEGLITENDPVFIKPDTDSGLTTAYGPTHTKCLEFIKTQGVQTAFLAGVTFYGCILGAACDLRDSGFSPIIIEELTDRSFLPAIDVEEAEPDMKKSNISVQKLLTVLQKSPSIRDNNAEPS